MLPRVLRCCDCTSISCWLLSLPTWFKAALCWAVINRRVPAAEGSTWVSATGLTEPLLPRRLLNIFASAVLVLFICTEGTLFASCTATCCCIAGFIPPDCCCITILPSSLPSEKAFGDTAMPGCIGFCAACWICKRWNWPWALPSTGNGAAPAFAAPGCDIGESPGAELRTRMGRCCWSHCICCWCVKPAGTCPLTIICCGPTCRWPDCMPVGTPGRAWKFTCCRSKIFLFWNLAKYSARWMGSNVCKWACVWASKWISCRWCPGFPPWAHCGRAARMNVGGPPGCWGCCWSSRWLAYNR